MKVYVETHWNGVVQWVIYPQKKKHFNAPINMWLRWMHVSFGVNNHILIGSSVRLCIGFRR